MRTRMRIWFTVLVLAFACTSTSQAELVLVENGVSVAPIIVFEDAPPMTRLAADELAEYMEKASAAKPAVIEGLPDPIPERAIWVGYQPVLDELFPDIDFDFQHPEEILIAANGNHLAIAGRDRWDPDNLRVASEAFQHGRRDVIGFQNEYGTANAVYTFLRDHLSVRWLWPGEEDTPAQPTISVAPFEFRYHPAIRMRHAILRASAPYRIGHPGDSRAAWKRFNRIQLDSLYAPANHAFGDWWDRFHETHPDYFALQPDGTRSGFPGPKDAKICEANPAVWEQWLADAEASLAEHPPIRVFSASENDGWMSGHCICERCRAWDHPDGERRRFQWQGLSQEYVALSERQVTFANQLARRLRERFPDKDCYVSLLAYGNSRPAPVEAVPDDNVIIVNVAHFFHDLSDQRYHSIAEIERESFIAWSKIAKNHIWRPNLGNHAGWKQGGPVDLERTAENFRLLADTGCVGVYFDHMWRYWATQGPLYYLIAQLAWNPRADAQATMDDYYQRGFGPAAEPVKAYWAWQETPYRAMVLDGREWVEAFDAAWFARAEQLLDQAESTLEGAPEKYGRRLAFVRAGYEFFRLQTENRTLVRKLSQADENADPKDLALARANWAAIENLGEQHSMFWFGGYALWPGTGLRPAVDPDFQR